MYGEHAAAAALLQHSVGDVAVLARGHHADAPLFLHVHREVRAAEERVGDVVTAVYKVRANGQHASCKCVAAEELYTVAGGRGV